MTQTTFSSDLDYWIDRLRDKEQCLFPVLNDGIILPPNETQSCQVSAPSVENLLDFCTQHDLQLSTVFQAAWGLVLRSYTAREDIILGYQDGLQETIPCHFSLARESSLLHALNSIETSYTHDATHRVLQYEELKSILKVSEEGLFNTQIHHMDVTFDSDGRDLEYQDDNEESDHMTSEKLPIVVEVLTDLTARQSKVNLRYHLTQLSWGQAKNVASALETALICIITGTYETIGEQNLFSDYHQSHVDKWNQDRPEGQNMTFHEAISIQIQAQPDGLAIDAWDQQLTYGELDGLSTLLARRLVLLGVKTGSKIPLVFEKSAWWVVSLLAVSKAGGAFVPVDVSQPVLRLKEIMDDVKPLLLLSSIKCADLLADCVTTTIVVSRSTVESLLMSDGILPDLPKVDFRSPAYVMYTSVSNRFRVILSYIPHVKGCL